MCKKLIYGLVIGMISCGMLIEVAKAAEKDLLGLWLLNEGAGDTVADLSGQGNNGVLVNPDGGLGAGGSAWDIDPVRDTVLSFSGNETSGAYVDCGDIIPEMTLVNHFTWAFWAKQEGDGTGVNMTMLGNRYGGAQASVQFIKFTPTNFEYYNTAANGFINYDDLPADEWLHHAVVKQGPDLVYFRNGEETGSSTTTATINPQPFYIGGDASSERWSGRISDVRLYTRALSLNELLSVMAGRGTSPELATVSFPEDEAVDVIREVVLSWSPGKFAGTHNVYFGESFDDVNSATVPTSSGQDANAYDVGRLEFEKTYFWRVDEVNATPDKTVFQGDIWSFQVEPYAIQIPRSGMVVTASSSANEFSMPDKTIDGSGLGTNGTHAIASDAMWFTASLDLDPWIQYEFDAVQKLETMRVWNSNSAAEIAIGWGVKDVEIAYSVDGENWDVLVDVSQLRRAPGSPTYNQYDVIDFGGVAAKVVRLNIASNWGGILMSYGLSEVQFDMIPAQARTPVPASGSTGVLPNAVVSWRAGREAVQHTIYVGTDANEVAEGLASSSTSSTNSLDLGSLDLAMGTTHYWRVDEVNEAEDVSVWAGPVWSFTTAAALIVDDFESYNNISPDRPFQSWLDGFGYSSDEYFPVGYGGNGTGAGIGHDIWSLSSPYYDGDIMETSSTIAGSGQSMPFYYGNTGGTASETERTFATPQDWTVGAAQTLSIAFRGTAGNTGSLYVKINGVKLTYPRAASNIAFGAWQAWNIDLSTVNTNLQSITKMAFGVDGSGASGMVLIDDITLHAGPGELITPVDPGTNGLVALYTFEGNFNDSSGNGHTGTIVGAGGTQIVSDPARGQVLSLPGGDDQYVEVGAVGISGTMPRTIGCWAKAANTSIPDWTLIFGFTGKTVEDGSGGNGSHFNIGSLGGPGGIGAHCWGWEETMVSDQEGLNWHHYAMTYDGTTIAYFLDGVSMDSDPGKSNVQNLSTSGDRVFIGSRVTQTSSFPGNVDDAVIYDRALSAEEILWIAGRTTPVDKPF